MLARIDRRPVLWLLLGVVLLLGAHLRWGIPVLAWFAPVPLVRYLRVAHGIGPRIALVLALVVAWGLGFVKIATEPVPLIFAVVYGLPLGLFAAAAYLVHDRLRRRLDPLPASLVLPAGLAVAEWVQHAWTPFASWGATAYTQLHDLPLLQVASVAGIAGVGFLVNWVAAAVEEALWRGPRARTALSASIVAVAVAHGLGAVRLASSEEAADVVLVATVDTDGGVMPDRLPSVDELDRWNAALFDRTRRAAAAGAELVVWPEAGTLVDPDLEEAWLDRLGHLAAETQVELVAAWVMDLGGGRIENKYAWFRPDGTLDHVYHKRHPVPGEPADPGTEPIGLVQGAAARMSGAICYDYDFPRLGLEHARVGADLVAVPASDWRGIDPLHTQMAAVRAIEGGHSVVRSTRWGLSAGIDPHGRIRGSHSHFDPGQDILLVGLPRTGTSTVYSVLGDWLVALSALFLAAAGARHLAATLGDRYPRVHVGDGALGSDAGARRGVRPSRARS